MIADITFVNHGSIVVLCGTSREGAAWLAENLEAPAMRWGAGIVVEPRYVAAILSGAIEAGLEIA